MKELAQGNAFFARTDQFLLAMCTDRDEAVRKEAVNKIRNLRDQYIPNTEDEAIAEGEIFPEVEEDGERPHIEEDLLIPTNDEAEEDTEVIQKTYDMPSKNFRKIILPKLNFHALNCHNMID